MSLRHLLGCTLVMSMIAISGCRHAEEVWPSQGKKRVLASFPPLYCFAKNVAGDDADVRCLITNQGPHDYEAKFSEVLMVRSADLILINGLDLDDWVLGMLKDKGRDRSRVVEIGEAIPHEHLLHSAEGGDHKHAGHVHKHGEHDPHVWLAPPLARLMVQNIAAKLGAIDPAHKKNYEDRAQQYVKELESLEQYGKAAFKNKKSRSIISTHDSLQYFADAFGLKIAGSIQPRPGVEADSQQFTGLVAICQKEGVGLIAVEPQYSSGPAEALRSQLDKRGVKVQIAEVDPLETAPAAANKADPDPAFYLERMKRNIDNLAKALP
jgi:zinc transport system substrate-binding protein